MNKNLGYYIRDFLNNYLQLVRNFSQNTIMSYRDTIKLFLKRENDFNKDNIDKVLNTLNKIDNDIKGVKKYNILEYFINLGWDTNLLLYFINNNKELINDYFYLTKSEYSDFIKTNQVLEVEEYDILESVKFAHQKSSLNPHTVNPLYVKKIEVLK